jgi:HPt (histidine-containing phosphotransfer) domain-containing protein
MPSLNRQRLDELVDYFGRPAAIEMIVNVIQGLDRHIAVLHNVEDCADTFPHAHKLKGLAAMYGLDDLAAEALSLESGVRNAGRATPLATLETLARDAQTKLQDFVRELSAVADSRHRND